jgi:hypothetical protein
MLDIGKHLDRMRAIAEQPGWFRFVIDNVGR